MSAGDGQSPRTGAEGQGGHEFDRRRKALAEHLADAGVADAPPRSAPTSTSGSAGMAEGLKLGSEFVAGVVVGAALGFALDYWVGTSPFGLIVFLLLGFAAGVLNVLRSVGKVAEPDYDRHKRGRAGDDVTKG